MILEYLLIYITTVHLHTPKTALTTQHHDCVSVHLKGALISSLCPEHPGHGPELNTGRGSLSVFAE